MCDKRWQSPFPFYSFLILLEVREERYGHWCEKFNSMYTDLHKWEDKEDVKEKGCFSNEKYCALSGSPRIPQKVFRSLVCSKSSTLNHFFKNKLFLFVLLQGAGVDGRRAEGGWTNSTHHGMSPHLRPLWQLRARRHCDRNSDSQSCQRGYRHSQTLTL